MQGLTSACSPRDGWSPWRAIFGLVSTVTVIGGIGAIVAWAFGRTATGERPNDQSGARDILDARYARGEVTREQYQQMRGDLKS